MRGFRYLHLDVFSERPFEGNPLAVFPAASGLASADMQAIAREIGFSETTFVLPADDPATDVRMRIFTPARELPIAGHPTIGSTFALAHEQVVATGSARFTFGLGAGPTPVDLTWDEGRLAFAWMQQPLPRFGPVVDAAPFLRALGLDRAALTALPAQVVSCGVPFLFLPLASRTAVDGCRVDTRALERAFADAGVEEEGLFVFTTEARDDGAVYSRMFAPVFNILEDPATGIASGPLGSYLLHHGAVPPERALRLLSLQGVAMGRPSRVHISIAAEGGAISGVRVGGTAVLVAHGTLVC
jgi:trans-2,3-dihydro-3-hydroxyanthranilate isomerase